MKKILITEKQSHMLAKFELNESNEYEGQVKSIVDDLNLNYEPIVGTYRKGGEYFEKPIIKVKADGKDISPEDLINYFNTKRSDVGKKFITRVVIDWINGDISGDYSLTKNVGLS